MDFMDVVGRGKSRRMPKVVPVHYLMRFVSFVHSIH